MRLAMSGAPPMESARRDYLLIAAVIGTAILLVRLLYL